MKSTLWFWLVISFVTLSMTTAFAAENPTLQRSPSRSQQSGTIEKVTNDKVTLKTDDGKTHSFTINEAQREEIKSLRQGDRIEFTLNQQNQIVGFNKQNGSGRDSRDSNRFDSNPNMNPNSNTNPNLDSGTGPNSNPNTTPSPNSPSNPDTNPNSAPAPSPNPMR